MKLARLAGPLAIPGRLEVDAVLTPRTVRATSPRLPGSIHDRRRHDPRCRTRISCATTSTSRCGTCRGTLSGSLRGYATPSPGARHFDRARDDRSARPRVGRQTRRASRAAHACWRRSGSSEPACAGPRPRRGSSMSRARRRFGRRPRGVRLELPAGQRGDSPPDAQGSGQRRARDARLAAGARGSSRSMVSCRDARSARILASPPAASGTLRGDFEATVDLTEPLRSRATGKLEGTGVALPDRVRSSARDRSHHARGGRRARAHPDTSLKLADQPLQLEGSIGRAGDGLRRRRNRDDGRHRCAAVAGPAAAGTGGRAACVAGRWPVRGRVALRAGHVDVLGYRVEPFVADVSLDERKLTADVTTRARVRDRRCRSR